MHAWHFDVREQDEDNKKREISKSKPLKKWLILILKSNKDQNLDFLIDERQQFLRIQKGFSLLVQVGFISWASPFSNEQKIVMICVCCIDLNLCREIGSCVHFIVHVKWCNL